MEQIQLGKGDVMFCGAGEAEDWGFSVMFDAMGALSTKRNDTPEKASRAFDQTRDGFVIAGGGGIVVLEELEHAKARGAKIYAELVGYGANSDGYDMVAPSGEGGRSEAPTPTRPPPSQPSGGSTRRPQQKMPLAARDPEAPATVGQEWATGWRGPSK